jgi:hypothetical protein
MIRGLSSTIFICLLGFSELALSQNFRLQLGGQEYGTHQQNQIIGLKALIKSQYGADLQGSELVGVRVIAKSIQQSFISLQVGQDEVDRAQIFGHPVNYFQNNSMSSFDQRINLRADYALNHHGAWRLHISGATRISEIVVQVRQQIQYPQPYPQPYPPPYQPPYQPPYIVPGPGSQDPVYPFPPVQVPDPISQGPRAEAVIQIQVGCKGRTEQMTVSNLLLSQDTGAAMIFRGSASIGHKCGNNGSLNATVEVVVPRMHARRDAQGYLLSPVVNAQVNCSGSTSWAGQTTCQLLQLK